MLAGLQPFQSTAWHAASHPLELLHFGAIKIHATYCTQANFRSFLPLSLPPRSSRLKHSSHILSSSLTPDLPSLSRPPLLSPLVSPVQRRRGPPRRGPINRPRFTVMMPLLMSVQLLQRWIGRINLGSSTSASLFHCHSLLSCVSDIGGKAQTAFHEDKSAVFGAYVAGLETVGGIREK